MIVRCSRTPSRNGTLTFGPTPFGRSGIPVSHEAAIVRSMAEMIPDDADNKSHLRLKQASARRIPRRQITDAVVLGLLNLK